MRRKENLIMLLDESFERHLLSKNVGFWHLSLLITLLIRLNKVSLCALAFRGISIKKTRINKSKCYEILVLKQRLFLANAVSLGLC